MIIIMTSHSSSIPTKIKQPKLSEGNMMKGHSLNETGHDEKGQGKGQPKHKKMQETERMNDADINQELYKMSDKQNINDVHSKLTQDAEMTCVKNSKTYYSLLILMCLLSLATRFYDIENPPHVCWDETHFGKMGSWYIKRSFFFDVHPPLGKMLIGLAGYLTGYDGEFPFTKPGDEYGDTEYVGMRMFCALLGAALVPLSYMSTWQLSKSILGAFFASLFVLLDVGTLTLSRHILLDPILMFFIMAATYCKLKFLSYSERPFSISWWIWLSLSGIFLACSIGVKFVGLFVILLVGLTTVNDLWRLLGDSTQSVVTLIKHFIARALCLIALPVFMYLLFFFVHFQVLNESGNGDGFYSSAFQSQLKGNRLYNISMPENLAFGSRFTLKQRRTGGSYLHSHWHLYPEEHPPRQQQITTYSHKDENNYWIIQPADTKADPSEKPQIVKSGDLVRLTHYTTKRNLHSHREPAALSKRHFQLSGYGEDGEGDANDIWLVEVVGASLGTPVQTARSKLKFIHYHVRCAIYSHDKKLPKWGFEQLEATCNPNLRDDKTIWSVEEVIDERLPNASFELYSPSFIEKLTESHAVMTQGNSGLKPKEGEITSRPWQWPLDLRGQIFSGKDHRIYLLGNPILFWGTLGIMGLFLLEFVVHAVKLQRGTKQAKAWTEYKNRMFGACWWLLLGWALHYLPFWPMTRVLYFHHYFPAFLFSAMISGIVLDYTVTLICVVLPENFTLVVFHTCIGLILSTMSLSFYLFYPLTYGMSGPMANDESGMMYKLKWLDSWDL